MKKISDWMYDTLRSVKLAAALIVLIILLAAAGGIIPQREPDQFYLQKFPGTPATIILSLGLDKIFTGLPFLILATLFTINLTVCTIHRFYKELRKPRKSRGHGPDILHIGLLIFIFGGILTARTRTEAFLYLGKGQESRLPDGSSITLVDLREERYPDGRPKSWESQIVIGEAPKASVKVNSPLRHKGYTIYQQDWKSEMRALLQDPAGIRLSLEPGSRADMKGGSVLFMDIDTSKPANAGSEESSNFEAVFLVNAADGKAVLKAKKGDQVGPFTFTGFEEDTISGLKIVRDRGYPFVAAGLALVVLGTFLTYIRKLKGMFA